MLISSTILVYEWLWEKYNYSMDGIQFSSAVDDEPRRTSCDSDDIRISIKISFRRIPHGHIYNTRICVNSYKKILFRYKWGYLTPIILYTRRFRSFYESGSLGNDVVLHIILLYDDTCDQSRQLVWYHLLTHCQIREPRYMSCCSCTPVGPREVHFLCYICAGNYIIYIYI